MKIFFSILKNRRVVAASTPNTFVRMIENAICVHRGSQSMNKKYLQKYKILRSWHYCWAKFYFFRKHIGCFLML